MKGFRFAILALAVLPFGCGGGSTGVTSGFPDAPAPKTFLPNGPGVAGGTALRVYRAGDTWEYEVSGTMLREEFDEADNTVSRNQGPVTGTLVRTLSSVTILGVPAFKVTDALSYRLNNGLVTVEILETYVRQNGDGSLTMLGRRQEKTDTAAASAAAGQAWMPGTFGPGANVGLFGRFNTANAGGSSFNQLANFDASTAFSVIGASSVPTTTENSPFSAWKAVYTDSMRHEWSVISWARVGAVTAGFVFKSVEDISSSDDWSPVLGAPVKRKYASTRRDSVVHGDVVYTPATATEPESVSYKYHTINRTLDLEMVLKSRSIQ
jgi:hypothetical protein